MGIFVTVTAIGDYRFFFLYSTLAAFITAYGLWKLIMEKRTHALNRFALLTGGLSGIVSHYVCWYMMYIGANLCYGISGGCTGSLGEPPADLFTALWGSLILSLWSWIIVGWFTLIVGMAIGGAIGWYAQRQNFE